MSIRKGFVVSALALGLVLPGSAGAMLPATESGYRPAHPVDCVWRCVKKKVPTTFERIRAAQREVVNYDLEASKRMMRISQQLQQMKMQMAIQQEILRKLAEATEAVVRNFRQSS